MCTVVWGANVSPAAGAASSWWSQRWNCLPETRMLAWILSQVVGVDEWAELRVCTAFLCATGRTSGGPGPLHAGLSWQGQWRGGRAHSLAWEAGTPPGLSAGAARGSLTPHPWRWASLLLPGGVKTRSASRPAPGVRAAQRPLPLPQPSSPPALQLGPATLSNI